MFSAQCKRPRNKRMIPSFQCQETKMHLHTFLQSINLTLFHKTFPHLQTSKSFGGRVVLLNKQWLLNQLQATRRITFPALYVYVFGAAASSPIGSPPMRDSSSTSKATALSLYSYVYLPYPSRLKSHCPSRPLSFISCCLSLLYVYRLTQWGPTNFLQFTC